MNILVYKQRYATRPMTNTRQALVITVTPFVSSHYSTFFNYSSSFFYRFNRPGIGDKGAPFRAVKSLPLIKTADLI